MSDRSKHARHARPSGAGNLANLGKLCLALLLLAGCAPLVEDRSQFHSGEDSNWQDLQAGCDGLLARSDEVTIESIENQPGLVRVQSAEDAPCVDALEAVAQDVGHDAQLLAAHLGAEGRLHLLRGDLDDPAADRSEANVSATSATTEDPSPHPDHPTDGTPPPDSGAESGAANDPATDEAAGPSPHPDRPDPAQADASEESASPGVGADDAGDASEPSPHADQPTDEDDSTSDDEDQGSSVVIWIIIEIEVTSGDGSASEEG